jgi:hypothetical protein
MPTFINTQGQVVDADTGEIVGRAEGAPVATEPRKAGAPDQVTEGADKVKGLINQASWGFNTALFALPDAAQRVIGRGLGLDDKQVFQFAKFFNRGEVSPRNSLERYSRAAGEGVGAGLPFTGVLGAAAAMRTPLAVATPAPTVMRAVAKDAMDMIAKSPKKALALDMAFGAGYETMRQAVEENVSDDQPSKALLKELLPAAAFVGLPLALSGGFSAAGKLAQMTPTGKAVGFAREQLTGPGSRLTDVEREVLESAPKFWQAPIVRIVPKKLMQNAERKLEQVFGPIAESKDAQEALAALRAAMDDPRFAEAGFVFDAAETTMYTPLVQEKLRLLQQLGPKDLEGVKARISQNQAALDRLFGNLSPEARTPVMDAFKAAQADRQAFFENLVRQKKDLTDAEVLAISERLGPQNINMLNNELRGVIQASMEADNRMRQSVLSRIGLKQATAPDGTPMPTRDQGKSLFDARDMEEQVLSLISKYKIERPSMRQAVPEPIRLLDSFVQGQLRNRERLEARMLNDLTNEAIDSQIAGMGKAFDDPEIMKAIRASVQSLVRGDKPKGGRRTPGLTELATPDAQGNVAIPTVIPGRKIIINPEQIRQDAARIAADSTKIDINIPEALDYLTAAQRFRNDALNDYNAAMMKGRVRQTDAQRILDTGNAVFKDVEALVLDRAPRLKSEYQALKVMVDDYKSTYDKTLPLLMTQAKRGGMEYLLPNEDLMRNAFKNADNLRSVTTILGSDEQAQRLMMNGTIDWLRSKGVVNKEGLIDPKLMRSVLDKNRNIVEALPQPIQARLKDELNLANDYVARLGEIDRRMVAAQDNELDRVFARASRPEADPKQVLVDAIRDPAIMKKLVDTMGTDPEKIASLRRSVYELAAQGAQGGGGLKSFLDTNEKSLRVLFGGTGHLDDLKKLADLQRRVNAFASVTGQIPAFESLDQALRRTFGTGIQFLTTTMREAMVGRIAPETGALALMVRMTGSLENELYKRIFTKALESPEFARGITNIATPKDGEKVLKQLQDIGISKEMIFGRPAVAATTRAIPREITDLEREGQTTPVQGMEGQPVVPRASASQMLRSLPPAPPTRGYEPNMRLPTTKPAAPASTPTPLMYPAMFPNDPISGILMQRQAAMRPAQPQQ